jgi:hypothetical protein
MTEDQLVIAFFSVPGLVFAVAAVRRHLSYKKSIQQRERVRDAEDERLNALHRNLLVKTLNDEAKVDRLIWLEREKVPNLSLEKAMESAIERWEKDNR